MWKDKLLKTKWRAFVLLLYVVMIGSIVLRLFPIGMALRNVLNVLQVWAAVCLLIFAWIYYNKPQWVREMESED